MYIVITLFISTLTFAHINDRPENLDIWEPMIYDQSELEEKKEIIYDIVDSYRDEIIKYRGSDVELIFSPLNIFQMTGGHVGDGKLEITVYAKALTHFDKSGIVSAICHELGHILGKVPVGGSRVVSVDSVEGEADYFSGICSRTYFCGQDNTSCPQAISASKSAIQAMNGTLIDESESISQSYPGVNKTYPQPACRLLSMISGVKGQSRPLCWYNPNYRPELEPKIYLQKRNYMRKGASCMYLLTHLGDIIKQTALSYNNQRCSEVGNDVIYKLVENYPNTYQTGQNDFLKIKSSTSLQFSQSVELLELGVGNMFYASGE